MTKVKRAREDTAFAEHFCLEFLVWHFKKKIYRKMT